jgi:cysteine sulfinate desulfinase/cysteine desulfurase-like protein
MSTEVAKNIKPKNKTPKNKTSKKKAKSDLGKKPKSKKKPTIKGVKTVIKKVAKKCSDKKDQKINPCDWIYLDNVSSSLLCPKAEQIYKKNLQTRAMTQTDKNKLIDESKEYILKMCDASPDKYSIFFTSGEIESNNIILCSAINAYKKFRKIKPHVVVSTVEHNSVIIYAKSLLDSGQIELSIIKPNSYGCILSDTVARSLKPNTCFVSITYINRELGSVNNIEKISAILHEKKIPLHCDCTYLFGKHKLDLTKTSIDTATIAFDKINGPIGVGALIISNDLYNGYKLYEHSTTLKGTRPHNIPAIASALEAFKISLKNRKKKNKKLLKFRNEIITKLSEKCQTMTFANFMKSDAPPLEESKKSKNKLVILGPPTSNESYYTPSILSMVVISDKKKTGMDIKQSLEKKGIIIGVPETDKNFMYKEIGMPDEALQHIIRISLADDITQSDINKFVAELKCVI